MSLVEKMRARASQWVEVGDGRAIQIERPPMLSLALSGNDWPTLVGTALSGWRGFTERDFLGPDATDIAPPFERAAADLWLRDHVDAMALVVTAMREMIDRRRAEMDDARGNSLAS